MRPLPPIPLECVALSTLSRMARLSKGVLAHDQGLSKSTMSKYMVSEIPPADRLERILEKMGFMREDYEELLSNLSRVAARRGKTLEPATPVDPTPEEWSEIHARSIAVGREAERRFLEAQVDTVRARKTAEAQAEARTLCALLEDDPRPWLSIEKVPALQTWAVAERLADRSAEIALDCVDRAMELAALAYRVAELAPDEGPFRESLLGYTLLHGENALRAAGDLAEAGALYMRAQEHWQAGASAPGPLQEWRLQGLAGSFHRDQQRLAESLAQLDASLASAPAREKGRLLVTKALTLERMGETGRAIELLVEAEQTVDRPRNPRLLFIILLNRASFLGRLGRFGAAELLLPEIAALADGLGRGLHQSRLCWLRGSLAAGLGRWEEAESHFQTARRELAYRNKILESALVALELMVLLCRREKAREIRMLAHWIAALVPNPSLSRDARAALRLVCAAEGSEVTLELAERALHLLQRAPKADGAGEPDLPLFAAAGASVVLAGGRQDGSVASTVGIESAAAVRRLATRRGLQEIGGRAPDSADPGDQPVHEAGGLHGAGAGRQGGRGSREANEEGETERETTPSVSASKHENAPSGSATRRGLSWPHRSHHPENTGAENRLVPSPEILPEDFATFVRVLMALRDLTQGELAAATELSPTTVGNYRQGKSTPPRIRPVAERLARALKVPDYVVDLYLLPGIAADRESQGGELADAVEPILQRLRDELRGLVHLMLPFGEGKDGDQPERSWPPAEAARNEALGLWARLEDCAEAERWSLVERWRELQHPGLAELLCHLSEEAASDRADQALALAKLARRVAELVPGDSAEKTGLVGCTGLCLANAVRVSGELLLARERFEEGHTSWKAGAGSTFLAEWRVLDLEASLLRDERQFGFALDQLERALAIAPVEFSGRILLNRAFTFEQMGDGEQALAELRKAEPLIDRAREPRLFLVLRFNTATALCLLDQFEEAERMVPKIQGLAAGLQKDLDNVRLKWLAGRIAAGRGRLAEADAALDEVRQEFTRNPSPWDCSLVTLELATVRLRQGRTAEVRHLAGELVWVFKAQGIHQEALAALALFREAAARDLATADFTERLVRYLRKAQGNPGLQFLA